MLDLNIIKYVCARCDLSQLESFEIMHHELIINHQEDKQFFLIWMKQGFPFDAAYYIAKDQDQESPYELLGGIAALVTKDAASIK